MRNKYVNFVSDAHLLKCVETLYQTYVKAKNDINKKKFYKNKIDTIKLTFDAFFNEVDEESLIKTEILRQIDKTINNSLGTFHEQVLGGIEGYESSFLAGYDIKANDDTLFADIKNKHNTMNSSSAEALFQKLARYADTYKKAKCYWVQILAKKSFCELWTGDINGKEYSHSRVYKISGDKFYELLSGEQNALYNLYKALPIVIKDFLDGIPNESKNEDNSAYKEIKNSSDEFNRDILDQITIENYKYYNGFNEL